MIRFIYTFLLTMICIFSSFAYAKPSAAADWALSSKLEKIPGEDNHRHVLSLSKQSKTLTYTPSKAPYGLVLQEKISLENRTYFLTAWSHSGSSVLWRVFEPESSGSVPLCEVVSESEASKLRFQKSSLEIQVVPREQTELVWTACLLPSKR